jgi:hypothetical protein
LQLQGAVEVYQETGDAVKALEYLRDNVGWDLLNGFECIAFVGVARCLRRGSPTNALNTRTRT